MPSSRRHIVLVPGFAGFDALGQLEYYAGVTPQFRRWQAQGGHADAVLHYFDNFPTAAVATRAERLRRYLAKRILRGEIADGDSLALVGHSTGGLDIRRLLWDLDAEDGRSYSFDGARDPKFTPTARKILRRIRRVVFLSVPQRGTNIADWVQTHAFGRKVVVAELRAAVETSQIPFLGKLEECLSNSAAAGSGLDLLYAIQDALSEAEACPRTNPMRTALAQEAGSALALWLRHMSTDFSAIHDLTARPPDGKSASPAHFDEEDRKKEKKIWGDHLRIRSYVTIGKRPFSFGEDSAAPTWDLLDPWTYPEYAKDNTRSAGTDIVYRTCYRACAGGPFRLPEEPKPPAPKPLRASKRRKIAPWDNDGIVNTASMLWPEEAETFLVEADHMDIVGHFTRVPAPPASGRMYEAYDLLMSDSGFDDAAFTTVWNGVFDFCVS